MPTLPSWKRRDATLDVAFRRSFSVVVDKDGFSGLRAARQFNEQ